MDLPEEVLADILRRVVPPRHRAECRRVCGHWRATIDRRRLVLPHLLPGAPRGSFINFTADGWGGRRGGTYFFARGGGGGGVDARLADAPTSSCTAFVDHRNGLLLCDATEGARFVYNPATRRSATLPPPPPLADPWGVASAAYRRRPPLADPWGVASAAYLLFDPAVSPHHEVFLLPELPSEPRPAQPDDPAPPPPFNVSLLFFTTDGDGESSQPPLMDSDEYDGEDWLYTENETRLRTRPSRRDYLEAKEAKDTLGLMEWPPSLYVAQVFSSVTGRWEERAFVREGGAAGAVADMWSDPPAPTPNYGRLVPHRGPRRRYAVYWRRFLYVHCRGSFIIRLSLLTGKYVVIKIPEGVKLAGHWWATQYLSKSQKGVYYTVVADLKLWVWVLNEESTTAPPMWEMVHHADLMPSLSQYPFITNEEKDKSWILDDPSRRESTEQGYCEWDSDDDCGVNVAEQGGNDIIDQYAGWLDFLGYHPNKEIVFFGYQYKHCAFAYYLRTSKLEYLGDLEPQAWHRSFPAYVRESFVYTPCRIDLLSDQNGTSVDLSNWV